MTKKDYEKAATIAQSFRQGIGYEDNDRAAAVRNAFCLLFMSDGENPRFNVQCFLKACEPGANVRLRQVQP